MQAWLILEPMGYPSMQKSGLSGLANLAAVPSLLRSLGLDFLVFAEQQSLRHPLRLGLLPLQLWPAPAGAWLRRVRLQRRVQMPLLGWHQTEQKLTRSWLRLIAQLKKHAQEQPRL
ncbi:unannotated protein [freshwater metagenome]|uniref:Unannotated protein n=1 Tax=freshwater metagenome TaxID=449393 RepID=A0A6J6BV67_9ZZZZ